MTTSAGASGDPGRPDVPTPVLRLATAANRLTVLTGAGMSAESGVPTFRDAHTGLWSQFDAIALATPQAWQADPELVWAWYLWRVALVRAVTPNQGHRALARWAALPGVEVQVVTQNVDDLHERAGSSVLAHLHGSLLQFRCDRCQTPHEEQIPSPDPTQQRVPPPPCRSCSGQIRPGVVWFGESLPVEPFQAATQACLAADLVLVVGTSGLVQPAAGLPGVAAASGVPVVEINPDSTEISRLADHSWRTTAATGLPALVDAVTAARIG